MTETTATLLSDDIEFASDGMWPQLKAFLKERGYTDQDLKQASKELVRDSGMDNLFEDGYEE